MIEPIEIARVKLLDLKPAMIEYELFGGPHRTIVLMPGDTLTISLPRDALTDNVFTIN